MNSANNCMTYTPPLRVRFWRWLGFHAPSAPMLSDEAVADGWNEQVFAHTDIYVCFLDRLRLLLSGRAKLFIIVSAKVTVPEAIIGVGFGIAPPFSEEPDARATTPEGNRNER